MQTRNRHWGVLGERAGVHFRERLTRDDHIAASDKQRPASSDAFHGLGRRVLRREPVRRTLARNLSRHAGGSYIRWSTSLRAETDAVRSTAWTRLSPFAVFRRIICEHRSPNAARPGPCARRDRRQRSGRRPPWGMRSPSCPHCDTPGTPRRSSEGHHWRAAAHPRGTPWIVCEAANIRELSVDGGMFYSREFDSSSWGRVGADSIQFRPDSSRQAFVSTMCGSISLMTWSYDPAPGGIGSGACSSNQR